MSGRTWRLKSLAIKDLGHENLNCVHLVNFHMRYDVYVRRSEIFIIQKLTNSIRQIFVATIETEVFDGRPKLLRVPFLLHYALLTIQMGVVKHHRIAS